MDCIFQYLVSDSDETVPNNIFSAYKSLKDIVKLERTVYERLESLHLFLDMHYVIYWILKQNIVHYMCLVKIFRYSGKYLTKKKK